MEELEFTVEDLVEGGEYEFRVKAANAAGVSKPSATVGPVIIKDQTCMYQHVIGEGPLYGRLPRYSKTQSKKMSLCVGSSHGLSLDTGPVTYITQLPQNYLISLHIAFPLLKGDAV